MKNLLFAAIDIKGKPIKVIGGGRVAERKVKKLTECGAVLTVIAPELTPAILELSAKGLIITEKRRYQKGDLSGAFMVVITTDDEATNLSVLDEARELNILTNSAFDKRKGDIFFMASREMGGFTVSVLSEELSPKKSLEFLEKLNKK